LTDTHLCPNRPWLGQKIKIENDFSFKIKKETYGNSLVIVTRPLHNHKRYISISNGLWWIDVTVSVADD